MDKTEKKLKKLLNAGKTEEAKALVSQFPNLSFDGSFRQRFIAQQNLTVAPIQPLTPAQKQAFEAYARGKNLLMHGVAGTGKSFLSLYMGLKEILDQQKPKYERLLIVRSVVPTRDMGFLPGSAGEKSAQYELPYQSLCAELLKRPDAYSSLKQKGIINFTTTSHLRGLTFSNTILVMDEVNNMTIHELDTCITRVGKNCRIMCCGDIAQTDLTGRQEPTGLDKFMRILKKMPSFEVVQFGVEDIVRSGVVREYLIAKTELETGKDFSHAKEI